MESAKQKSLKSKTEAYFAACDATAERVTLEKRKCNDPPDTVYAFAGLSEHLAIPQGEILAKSRKGGDGPECALYADALRRIGRYIAELPLITSQYSAASVASKNPEVWRETPPPPTRWESKIVIVLEDREGWDE
ncbi:MAG: hypothetical protein R2912_10120 [Eubacteriales bacterium]